MCKVINFELGNQANNAKDVISQVKSKLNRKF